MKHPLAVVAVALALGAWAEEPWRLEHEGPLTLRTRARAGLDYREARAEGDIQAPLALLSELLHDTDRFAEFMPGIVESRRHAALGGEAARKDRYWNYLRLDFGGLVSQRDAVTEVEVRRVERDGRVTEVELRWKARPELLPERPGVVRVRANFGAWRVVELAPGRCRVSYTLAVDPGGMLPAWAVDPRHAEAVEASFVALQQRAEARARAPR